MGYFWSKPEPVNVDYESESEMESTREMMNNWKRYNSVKKELEARGAKTFGSLERMEQRLQRFLDMEKQQAKKAARLEKARAAERARIERAEEDALLRIDVLRMSRDLAAPETPPQSPRTPTLPPLLRRQNARDDDDEVYTEEEFMIDQINENWIHFKNTDPWNRPDALADVSVSIYALQSWYERARDVQQQIMMS